MKEKLYKACSFCGREAKDESVAVIVATDKVGICNNCVVDCVNALSFELHKRIQKEKMLKK